MSAIISDKVMMKEILKATGFDCPQGIENLTFEQATSGGGGGGGTITPYAKKVYIGRGFVSALVFDHTQITGECSYTDIDSEVSTINLQNNTNNLWLQQIDVISFELEINGSKLTVNVN